MTGGVRREAHEHLALAPAASLQPGQPHAGHGRERRAGARRAPARASAATIASSRSSTSPTKNASKNGASGQGLATAGPAAEDDGVALAALGGVQRHAGQVEHLEHVGVA